MTGPTPSEAPKQNENIHDKLQALHAGGILLSETAEKQLIDSDAKKEAQASWGHLERMTSDLQNLEKMRTGMKGKPYEITQADFNLVEGNLRKINDLSEVEQKHDVMHDVYSKYLDFEMADRLDAMAGALPPARRRFRPDEIAKVHSLPLKEASKWASAHVERVSLLNKLTDAKIIPASEYENFRRMDPGEAYAQLRTAQANHEKKEHASADDVLNQDLNRVA